ncbi:hypothetical protein NOR51B_2268 [Luminiphilus syltensis NOR5-1B]|uniref:Uncharacterized protein n=2 Tax=Luminiphilus TaxID=1341118 RepID=B8KVG4_9GAMM|nr:hypothetical protein NOR51B_2268 [Luminiphilus syltensis NOR5-1B]
MYFRQLVIGLQFLTSTLVATVALGAEESLLHEFDFSGVPGQAPYEWLAAREFSLERHADNRDRIELYHANEALHVRVKKPSFGMVVHELDLPGAKHLDLDWGVSDYPEGASYEQGVDNEAIMVYVFFGHERQSSGEMFVPDSPYFIGFYLCPPGPDDVDEPYAGHHYQKTGRYICMAHPEEGQSVTTRIDLEEEFSRSFDIPYVPVISGISIEVDTTDSKNDGHAAAFIRRLAFYP